MTRTIRQRSTAGTAPSPSLGHRVREARMSQRLSLAELGERAGLTKGFLSRLERDQGSISVASLMRLCGALDMDVADLFDKPTGHLVRANEMPRIIFGGHGLTEFQLTPGNERRVCVLLSEIEPGGGSGEELYTLPIDVEFVYVIAGQLDVYTPDELLRLGAGDSLFMPGTLAHSFRNAGTSTTKVLWVLSPALAGGKRS